MEPQVIFEDTSFILINKPSGMVVNRAESVKGETIQDWVEGKYRIENAEFRSDEEFISRSGVVHRLDKETSGILIIAKTPEAFHKMQEQFKLRMVTKKYLALVHGLIADENGTIKADVGRLPWNRERFGVMEEGEGKESETNYKVMKRFRVKPSENDLRKHPGRDYGFSLVELMPKTGRTHQIRVHMKSIGHPVVADEFYAGRKTARDDRKWCSRLFLHAAAIEFCHPITHEMVNLEAGLPQDLKNALTHLEDS